MKARDCSVIVGGRRPLSEMTAGYDGDFELRQRLANSSLAPLQRQPHSSIGSLHKKYDEAINIDSGYEDSSSPIYITDHGSFKNKVLKKSRFVEDSMSFNNPGIFYRIAIILVIIIIIFASSFIMFFFKAGKETVQYSTSVSHVSTDEEDEIYPTLKRNFLLKEDITFDEVKKMKRIFEAEEDNLIDMNVMNEIFKENQELLDKVAKTFSVLGRNDLITETGEFHEDDADGEVGGNKETDTVLRINEARNGFMRLG